MRSVERTGEGEKRVVLLQMMSSVKGKKFRRRADDDKEDELEESTTSKSQQSSNSSAPRKEKSQKEKKPSGTKLLSFAEDEDNMDGTDILKSVPKKDKHATKAHISFEGPSASLLKSKKKEGGFGALPGSVAKLSAGKDKNTVIPSNFQPQAGEYTKEKLMELQRSTIRLGGGKASSESKSSEPVVVLKGTVKPSLSSVAKSEILEANAVSQTVDGKFATNRLHDVNVHQTVEKDEADSRLGLMGIGGGAEGGGVTHIPDAAAIAAAKAKRERLRQAQAAPDYIPVGNIGSADMRGKSWEASSQVKENGLSSDDEAEPPVRIAMLGELPNENLKGGVFGSMEEKIEDKNGTGQREGEEEEEEEEEERKWEEEQLRKGFGKRVDDSANRSLSMNAIPHQDINHSRVYIPQTPLPSSAWGFGGQNMDAMMISQKANDVMSTFRNTLQRTKENYNRIESELHKTEENLTDSLHNISMLEESLSVSNEKYVYMQKLQDYIAVLCDFLKSKCTLIEELEEHMQRLREGRAAALTNRRLADDSDEMLEIESAVNAAKAALNRGASLATATAAASQSSRDSANVTQLDEFGRDLNLQKRLEAKQRAEARERRRARAVKKKLDASSIQEDRGAVRIEGESSTDESESDEKAFHSVRAEILDTAAKVFSDAAEEFSELDKVKETLEVWKRKYFTAYRDAYVSLSAPLLFAPYVRLELLKWDPLDNGNDLSSMNWHNMLFDYGMPENGDELSTEDEDTDLVPKLVEKVALPILHHHIAHCWDIFSTKSTKNAVAAVQEIFNYVPASSDALQDLLSTVRSRLSEGVAKIEIPTWSHQLMSVVPQAAKIAAYRFGTSIRLLRNVSLWKDVLAKPLLEQFALDELLHRKMLPHLRQILSSPYDVISRTERVISAISPVWIGLNVTNRSKLEPLMEFVMRIGETIEKRRDAGNEDVSLARRLKQMLVELNEYDKARQLCKVFQLKEAL